MSKKIYQDIKYHVNSILTEEALSNDNEWRLLRRLHLPDVFNEESSKKLKRRLFVDVETTLVDPRKRGSLVTGA